MMTPPMRNEKVDVEWEVGSGGKQMEVITNIFETGSHPTNSLFQKLRKVWMPY